MRGLHLQTKYTMQFPIGLIPVDSKYIQHHYHDYHICERKLIYHGDIDLIEMGEIFFHPVKGGFTCLNCQAVLDFVECFDPYISRYEGQVIQDEGQNETKEHESESS